MFVYVQKVYTSARQQKPNWVDSVFVCGQEHAERAEVVQRLVADAQVLVQQAQLLEIRLDKDVIKLQVRFLH